MEKRYALARKVFWIALVGLVGLSLTFCMAFAPAGASANWVPWMFSPPEPPPLVRLTGALFPVQDKAELPGLYNFPVFIGGQTWVFHVQKAQSLTGSLLGSSLLNDLFPMRLRFVGPKGVFEQIEAEAGPGRTLTLTGRLYISQNWLLITSVKWATGETAAS